MIRRLRVRHRRTVLVVALVVGSLLIAALLARRAVPVLGSDPDEASSTDLVVREGQPAAGSRR